MKKIFIALFILTGLVSYGQSSIVTADSTGKLFVIIVRNDSIAVVYQGKQSVYTTDEGLFMKNFSAFDLKLKGFFKEQKLLKNLSDFNTSSVSVTPPVIIPPVLEEKPVNLETNAYSIEPNFRNKIYATETGRYDNKNNSDKIINGMKGYDFSPMVLNKKESSIENWKQYYVKIDGEKDVWSDGNATYFLKPKGYLTNLSYNLMDFDIRFPNFQLPKNKIVIIQATPERDKGVYNYLNKGVSYVKGSNNQKGYTFVSDDWLYELGCPPAYVASQESFDKWCRDVNSDDLLRSFISKIYFPCKDLGYVMLNWEAVSWRWNVRKDKIIRCLEYWKNNPHTAKMSLWMVSKVKVPKPFFLDWGVDYSLTINNDINSNIFKELTHVYDDYHKYIEVAHIGGYQNYPTDDGLIHHYLTELILNKKYSNNILLASIWHDQEPLENFGLDMIEVNEGSFKYLAEAKPRITPSTAQSYGAWCVAVGDGLDMWSDVYWWTENKENWGTNAYDLKNVRLTPKFGENLTKYAAQPLKAVDWTMAGVWAVSENKDIIEAKTEWKWKELPPKSYHDKSVLIAYKLNESSNEALILALDGFGLIDSETTHEVNINNKVYKIKTYGRFTSVIRLKL